MGRATALRHTPGTKITGGVIKHAERVITIDDLLIAPTFIANIDEAMNHYDVRSVYTKEAGNILGETMDRNVLQTGILAARATKTINDADQFGGTTIYGVDPDNGESLANALFEAARVLDEKRVAASERVIYVRPAQFYAMANSTKLINKDWGGQGSFADGNIIRVAGFTIIKTNNLPGENVAAGSLLAGTDNKYAGDFSATVGLVMHPSAVGTVKLLDLKVESEYQIEYQGTLFVSKYAVGHGILRPEAAVELSSAAAPV